VNEKLNAISLIYYIVKNKYTKDMNNLIRLNLN